MIGMRQEVKEKNVAVAVVAIETRTTLDSRHEPHDYYVLYACKVWQLYSS